MELVNLGSLLIQLVNLSVVVYVLYRFIFKPYLAFIDEETAKREAFEENARAAEHIISDARKEAGTIMDAAKNEARAIVADSEALAKKEYSLILSDARKEAEQIKVKASKDIENERQALHNELRERVLSIALRANEKLFGKSEANAAFIAQVLKEEK
ncbi:MAG: ATP synthase F0 subunit B [Candidatus Gracilibacteria bacterium]|nr:ATP synthase F0 subunit B [Candidatus Gracilibacteria bacterium]